MIFINFILGQISFAEVFCSAQEIMVYVVPVDKIVVIADHTDFAYHICLGTQFLFQLSCDSFAGVFTRFKAAAGTTVWTYLTLQKLEKAKKLLAETSLDIDEIAGDCGFRDPSYFTRQFRKYFQETPVDYRRKHSLLILHQTRNFKVRKKDLKKC